MSVKIRLARGGSRKKVMYRIVAADSRMKRDGRYLEKLGTYDPHTKEVILNKEATQKWLDTGAIPSETMHKMLIKQGFNLPALVFKEKPKEAEPVKEEAKEEAPAPEEAAPAEAPEEAKTEEAEPSEKAAE